MNYTKMREKIMMKIPEASVMDRQELYAITTEVNPEFKDTLFRNMLEKLMENGDLVRVGRNQYRKKDATNSKVAYKNQYSTEAQKIVEKLQNEFPLLEYRIWELCWLNEFWNHQIAQNKIFVEVEHVGCDFVYTELSEEYSGRILLRPTEKELYRYGGADTVIVDRMVSEAPKGQEAYNTPLEKIIVDLFANKRLRGMVHDGEYANAIADMFDKYYIDQVKLFRYASRRSKKEEIYSFLTKEAKVEIITGGIKDVTSRKFHDEAHR